MGLTLTLNTIMMMNTEMKENKKKMRILLGESMGGAMALLLHRRKPDFWDGAVLVAPMCKVCSLHYFKKITFKIDFLVSILKTYKIKF